ncbi:MAG: T9SS type A sorting domain-containing protein [Saprospirales bacterium]|nr:T9SS type A sorting domain-containing protein [Saprospirales bacterium]
MGSGVRRAARRPAVQPVCYPGGRFLLVGDSNSGIGGDKTEPSRGDFDGWVVEIDPSGNWYWDKTFGGSGPDYFLPALALSDNGYLFCGGSKSGVNGDKALSNRGDWDFWVVKTTANCAELDIAVEPELTPVTCLGGADGSIFVAVSGGTAPYTYAWSTGEESSSIVNQAVGLYSLTIEEASGCRKTVDFELDVQPRPLAVQLLPCQTVFSGYREEFNCASLIPQVSGGCPPYSYSWSTGETTEEIKVCPPVSTFYSLTVADQAGQEWVALTEVEVLDVRCGNNLDKVLVCQMPPDNPDITRTLCVAPEAVPALLTEGGHLGPCDWEGCTGSMGRAIAGGKLDPNLVLGRATGWEEPVPPPLLSLFPNPAGDFLVADLRFFPEGKYDISIFNETGKMLISQKIEIPGSIGWHADLRSYPSGLYWLQVRGEEFLVNEKFMVKSVSQ